MDKDLLVWCVIMLAGFYGWVNNIITLFGISDVWSASLLVQGEVFVRVAGIFMAPLGAIMGYF